MGMEQQDQRLESHLQAARIPYATFGDAEAYPADGGHWTSNGHGEVARRMMELLAQAGIARQ